MAKAYYRPGEIVGFAANGAINQGQLVEITGSFQVGPATADSVKVIGVAVTQAENAGDAVSVVIGKPLALVKGAAAISAGTQVVAAANGEVVAYNSVDGDTPDMIVGKAVEDIATDGQGYIALF